MPKKVKKHNQENPLKFEFSTVGKRLATKNEAEFYEIYKHPHGSLFQGDSIEWLKSLDAESVDLIFADPPYNINKAEWDRFVLKDHIKTFDHFLFGDIWQLVR